MKIFIRSFLFNIYFMVWTLVIGLICAPLLVMPNNVYKAGRIWAMGALWGLKVICGISHVIKGRKNIPQNPAIIASKHQSAWDTMIFFLLFEKPVYILKRELYFLPVINIYVWAMDAVAIDRSKGARAIKQVINDSVKVIESGKSVVIYPEGTRTKPGTPASYKSGVAGLYKAAGKSVVPIALNSGIFWGKNSFYKKPGTITLEILPEIKPGLAKDEFMKTLEETIENASTRLYEESKAQVSN